jgi:hypothetical protein
VRGNSKTRTARPIAHGENFPIVTGNYALIDVIISAPKISLESISSDGMGGL